MLLYANPTLDRRIEQARLARDYRAGLRSNCEIRVTARADGKPRIVVKYYAAVGRLAGVVKAVAVDKEA